MYQNSKNLQFNSVKRAIKKFDLFNYLDAYCKDFKVRSEDQFYYTNCWNCGKEKLFIHASSNDNYKGYWRCWVCGHKGDIFDLIAHFEQVSRKEAWRNFNLEGSEEDYTDLGPILQLERNNWDKAQKVKINPPIELPMNFRPLSSFSTDNAGYRYAVYRGITPDLMDKFDIRYNAMMQRIIFPIKHRGEYVGWQARAISNEMTPKLLSSQGFKKSLCLYNFDNVADAKSVMIVEGPIDAIKGHTHNAVALLGKTMSEDQYKLLLRLKYLKEVLIALDPDAEKEAYELGRKLYGIWSIRMLRLPQGKDIGDSSPEDIEHYIKISKFFNVRTIL